MSTTKWIITGIVCLLVVIAVLMYVMPQYRVYSQRKEGEAMLAHAQSSKEVAVTEARAKLEAAGMLAAADTVRAKGVAISNKIR